MRLINLFIFLTLVGTLHAYAQPLTEQEDKLNSIERDVENMQKMVSSLNTTDGISSQRLNATTVAQLEDIKENMRKLRGSIEQIQFDNARLNEKMVKMAADMEYRFHQLEKSTSNEGRKVESIFDDLDEELDNDLILQESDDNRPQANKNLEKALNDPVLMKKLKDKDLEESFKDAQTLLKQKKYKEAIKGLREIITLSPSTDLAGNSHYWIGEVYFSRKEFDKSAVEYLKGYQSSIRGSRASDNLLKLGKSMAKLEKRKEACTTFAKLKKEFPKASNTIKNQLEEEMKMLRCS